MLGASVVAVKGMHNHPPRALCLPGATPAAVTPRRTNPRKPSDGAQQPITTLPQAIPSTPAQIEALSVLDSKTELQ